MLDPEVPTAPSPAGARCGAEAENGTAATAPAAAVDPNLPQRPGDLAAVPALLAGLQRDTAAYLASSSSSSSSASSSSGGGGGAGDGEATRQALVRQARALQQALATPRETMLEHCWAQPGVATAITVGVDRGLWRLMSEPGRAARPQTVSELAAGTGVEADLLGEREPPSPPGRLMRHLAAMGYLEETGPDEYKPTNFSRALSLETMGDSYFPMLVVGGPAQHGFVEVARARAYGGRFFADGRDTAYMHAHGTARNFFALNAARGYAPHFAHHMAGYRAGRPEWFDFYPVRPRLMAGFADERRRPEKTREEEEEEGEGEEEPAFLVDVGGSTGHDLHRFRAAHPDHPGALVLEDLADVVAGAKQAPPGDGGGLPVLVLAHDFLAEAQPVRGARAYYLHSVLHDWADAEARRLLAGLAAAMRPGYSRLLVHENVVPPRGARWETTALDMVMLTLCGSRERTQVDWEALLGGCGLRILRIWSVAEGVESLIECELA